MCETLEANDFDSCHLISKIQDVSGLMLKPPVEVITDTTDFTRIHRGHVLRLEAKEFLVSGDVYETRFGLEDQPKFWVKRGYDLDTGQKVIIKLEFREEFEKTLGPLRIHCYRSPAKEREVLQLVAGDSRFMQGKPFFDDSGNIVRILEFIYGKTLYNSIMELEIDHEYYYQTHLAHILRKIIGCLEAIQMLHDHGICHGDIRNDHIMIDDDTGEFRWIDFDLCQDSADFDVLSVGKVLQFVIGMGLNTFHEIRTSGRFSPATISNLQPSDSSAFYAYRLMNLKKIYPYIGEHLNNVLMHFSSGASEHYRTIFDVTEDLRAAISEVPCN